MLDYMPSQLMPARMPACRPLQARSLPQAARTPFKATLISPLSLLLPPRHGQASSRNESTMWRSVASLSAENWSPRAEATRQYSLPWRAAATA
jgi:hypothetical protein